LLRREACAAGGEIEFFEAGLRENGLPSPPAGWTKP
jgi:hypothetical protein